MSKIYKKNHNTRTCACEFDFTLMILCINEFFMEEPLLSSIEQYVVDVVRAKRLEKGWSQKELAYQLDVSIGFIGDIENPKYRAKFNLNHINELAKIFECSPKDFLPEDPL